MFWPQSPPTPYHATSVVCLRTCSRRRAILQRHCNVDQPDLCQSPILTTCSYIPHNKRVTNTSRTLFTVHVSNSTFEQSSNSWPFLSIALVNGPEDDEGRAIDNRPTSLILNSAQKLDSFVLPGTYPEVVVVRLFHLPHFILLRVNLVFVHHVIDGMAIFVSVCFWLIVAAVWELPLKNTVYKGARGCLFHARKVGKPRGSKACWYVRRPCLKIYYSVPKCKQHIIAYY